MLFLYLFNLNNDGVLKIDRPILTYEHKFNILKKNFTKGQG